MENYDEVPHVHVQYSDEYDGDCSGSGSGFFDALKTISMKTRSIFTTSTTIRKTMAFEDCDQAAI